MTIYWHKRAAAQLHEVEDYVLRDFGERVRQEFTNTRGLERCVSKFKDKVIEFIHN